MSASNLTTQMWQNVNDDEERFWAFKAQAAPIGRNWQPREPVYSDPVRAKPADGVILYPSLLLAAWTRTGKIFTRNGESAEAIRLFEAYDYSYRINSSVPSLAADFRDALVDAFAEHMDDFSGLRSPYDIINPQKDGLLFHLFAFHIALSEHPGACPGWDGAGVPHLEALVISQVTKLPTNKSHWEVWEDYLRNGRCRFHEHATGSCWRTKVPSTVLEHYYNPVKHNLYSSNIGGYGEETTGSESTGTDTSTSSDRPESDHDDSESEAESHYPEKKSLSDDSNSTSNPTDSKPDTNEDISVPSDTTGVTATSPSVTISYRASNPASAKTRRRQKSSDSDSHFSPTNANTPASAKKRRRQNSPVSDSSVSDSTVAASSTSKPASAKKRRRQNSSVSDAYFSALYADIPAFPKKRRLQKSSDSNSHVAAAKRSRK